MSDAIEPKIRMYVGREPRWSVVIGDERYEFPPGTTRSHAQSVLDEAKRRVMENR